MEQNKSKFEKTNSLSKKIKLKTNRYQSSLSLFKINVRYNFTKTAKNK